MLVIQDPTDEQSTYLLESLLDAFHSAERVAGAFAFASSAGVRLFTGNDSFKDMASKHPVDLVVGIDAVTNDRALDSLCAVSEEHPNVKVRVFLNPRPGALFHPKFCWTKNKNGGHLIAGSGNLTEGGLLGHWEAYSVEKLNSEGIAAVESAWNSWTTKHHKALLPLDNGDVRRQASANNILAPEGDLPTLVSRATPSDPGEEPATTQVMASTAEVLVAEIPESGNRWNQVNFHVEDFRSFFGVHEGKELLVVFRHVNGDGTMAEYEHSRQAVTVKSRNFRFELSAALGVSYPDPSAGRPIGVYVRVATRAFFYRLMLPGDSQYAEVSALLLLGKTRPAREMRTARMTVAELRQEWPNSPFWKLQTTV